MCVHIYIYICMYQSLYIKHAKCPAEQKRQFGCLLDNEQCRVKTILFLLLYKDKFAFLKFLNKISCSYLEPRRFQWNKKILK